MRGLLHHEHCCKGIVQGTIHLNAVDLEDSRMLRAAAPCCILWLKQHQLQNRSRKHVKPQHVNRHVGFCSAKRQKQQPNDFKSFPILHQSQKSILATSRLLLKFSRRKARLWRWAMRSYWKSAPSLFTATKSATRRTQTALGTLKKWKEGSSRDNRKSPGKSSATLQGNFNVIELASFERLLRAMGILRTAWLGLLPSAGQTEFSSQKPVGQCFVLVTLVGTLRAMRNPMNHCLLHPLHGALWKSKRWKNDFRMQLSHSSRESFAAGLGSLKAFAEGPNSTMVQSLNGSSWWCWILTMMGLARLPLNAADK